MSKSTKNSSKSKKNNLRIVKNLADFKKLLEEKYYEFRIILSGGIVYSKKEIFFNKITKKYHILNCIDGSQQKLDEQELMSKNHSNIGEAINKHSLAVDLNEKWSI